MALSISYTLAALAAELRELAVAGEPQESFCSRFGWLASLVKGLGIMMRVYKCTARQFFRYAAEKSGSAGSCGDRTRDAASPISYRTGGGSRFCAECNGTVIDVRTWTSIKFVSVNSN